MGGIIIDYKTALVFKGPVAQRKEAYSRLKKIRAGTNGLKVESELNSKLGGMVVKMQFKGSMSQFENLAIDIEILRNSIAIDTVPLPEYPKGGAFPWPKRDAGALSWIITVVTKSSRLAST